MSAGLSQRAVGRMVALSHGTIGRVERGDVATLSVDRIAVIAAVLGLELGAALHPSGSPVRDAGHLALLARFRSRVGPKLRFRTEVPMPIPGDARSADGYLTGSAFEGFVEAETHVDDVQALLRRLRAKQRDLGNIRAILVLSDTRHHRALLRLHPELRAEFPIGARALMRAISEGHDPGGDAITLL